MKKYHKHRIIYRGTSDCIEDMEPSCVAAVDCCETNVRVDVVHYCTRCDDCVKHTAKYIYCTFGEIDAN